MSRIFLISATLLLTIFSSFSAKSDNFYDISNIYVSEIGSSPNDARTKAFNQARKNGLITVLKKLEIDPIILEEITDAQIAETVKSEQVKKEVIAGNNYSATFNIIYDKNFIDYVFQQEPENLPKTQQTYVLIPVQQNGGQSYYLWEKQNIWKDTITKLLDKTSSNKVSLIIPDADIENITTINDEAIKKMSYDSFESTLTKYNANGVYSVFFDEDKANSKINVDIFFIGNLQKKHVRLGFINTNNFEHDFILNKVAERTINYLLSNKSIKIEQDINSAVEIQIINAGLTRFLQVRQIIETSGIANNVITKSISRDAIKIIINYKSANLAIEDAFLNIGLELQRIDKNRYIIK